MNNIRTGLIISKILKRYISKVSTKPPSSSGGSASTQNIKVAAGASATKAIPQVPGLSSNCVKIANKPVGPGASTTGEYKVPEYFCYSRVSFAEAEIEMAKYRLPQPSALKK